MGIRAMAHSALGRLSHGSGPSRPSALYKFGELPSAQGRAEPDSESRQCVYSESVSPSVSASGPSASHPARRPATVVPLAQRRRAASGSGRTAPIGPARRYRAEIPDLYSARAQRRPWVRTPGPCRAAILRIRPSAGQRNSTARPPRAEPVQASVGAASRNPSSAIKIACAGTAVGERQSLSPCEENLEATALPVGLHCRCSASPYDRAHVDSDVDGK